MISNKVSGFFKPSLLATVMLFLLATLFATLGIWQIQRGDVKAMSEHLFETAKPLSLAAAIEQKNRFTPVNAIGRYDTERHILLDNQVWQGRAGVHVFTPFYPDNGQAILVNRGWLPLPADRLVLPLVATPQEKIEVRGILNSFPVPGRVLGPADSLQSKQWPQLVTYLNNGDLSTALETPLSAWVIQLAKTQPYGFDNRNWKPVFLTSAKHGGYAFQWFALAGICIVLWFANGIRRSRGKAA